MRIPSNLAALLIVWSMLGFTQASVIHAASPLDSESSDVASGTVNNPAEVGTPLEVGALNEASVTTDASSTESSSSPVAAKPVDTRGDEPWDYSPYRILVWIISDNASVNTETLAAPLHEFLDRQFAAVWQVKFETAPAAVASVANRSLADLDYETISASDPVIAVKRTDPDAARMRSMGDLSEYVEKILCTSSRAADLKGRIVSSGDSSLEKVTSLLSSIDGDALTLKNLWAEESTEAMLISRGMALTLTKPEAKLITPPASGLVADSADQFDKIFIVNIEATSRPMRVGVVELDTLMQAFGPVVEGIATNQSSLVSTIGSSMIKAFAPVVRIDDAGQKSATGLLRAGGLILDKNSPATINPGDVLIPMVRKNDRNGKPIQIGPLTWAFLLAVENEISSLDVPADAMMQLGDKVISINEMGVSNARSIVSTLRESPLKAIAIEVERGGKNVKLELERDKFATLRPLYYGFVAVDKGSGDKQQLLVTTVLKGSPADGKLEVGDVIVSVGKSTGLDAKSLRQLVISMGQTPPSVEFTVKRGEATQTVSIEPSELSDTERRQSSAIEMDFHAGLAGGLQGRNNSRTFRMAFKARPFFDNTMIRMHVRGAADEPLIGYEIYEKAMDSKDMTFLGRTDWNGRIWLEKTRDPLRLLYVKNGGAVLARLPIVPGQSEVEVADMTGDDMRLQAEAYIRGVQNAIVDLIAIRELLGARVRLRLKKGEMKEAEELLELLRAEPTNERIADDMGKKQTDYLKILGNGNANQRKMIDQMFTTTRELLSKHINPKMIRDLEDSFIAAKKNGGKLPEPPPEDDGTTVAKPTASKEPAAEKAPAKTDASETAPAT